MKTTTRPNPWPTPEQRLGELQTIVREYVSADLLWQTFSLAEQRRLGGDMKQAFLRYGRTLGMWIKLHGVTPRRAILDVARRIDLITEAKYEQLLQALGETGDTLDAQIKHAVQTHRLVLVVSRKELYFDQRFVPIKWQDYGKTWMFLQRLIRCAPTRRPVTRGEINEETKDVNYLSKLLSKLACLPDFPPQLKDLIIPAGQGSYVLELDATEICILPEAR